MCRKHQDIINVQLEDKEVSSVISLHKNNVVGLLLAKVMFYHEGIKFSLPLVGCLLQLVQAFLHAAYQVLLSFLHESF